MVLDKQHANDLRPLENRGQHRSSGMISCLDVREQFRAAFHHPPDEGVRRLWLESRWDFHPLSLDRGDVEQRKYLVAFGKIQVERKIVPLEQPVRRLANDHRRLRRGGYRTQTM